MDLLQYTAIDSKTTTTEPITTFAHMTELLLYFVMSTSLTSTKQKPSWKEFRTSSVIILIRATRTIGEYKALLK
tara:strand:+ start:315 stop:536 length:222 start_codon:yes stop_codon:yes gene_type:complete